MSVQPSDRHKKLPGWSGKIPSYGDFLTVRLPESFVLPWNNWLDRIIGAGKEKYVADWAEIYFAAPPWSFIVSFNKPIVSQWTGVVLPSCDRVGRQFPLTFAIESFPEQKKSRKLDIAWHEKLTEIALEVVEREFNPFDIDRQLERLPNWDSEDEQDTEKSICTVEKLLVAHIDESHEITLDTDELNCRLRGHLAKVPVNIATIWWTNVKASRYLMLNFPEMPTADEFMDMLKLNRVALVKPPKTQSLPSP